MIAPWNHTITLLLGLILAAPGLRAAERPQVLLINSYHQGYLWTDEITRGIQLTLAADSVDLHIEYLDAKRSAGPEYELKKRDLLRHKHERYQFDAIITSDNLAFEFLTGPDEPMFPDTPVFFCGINYLEPSDLDKHPLTTGVNEKADLASNLDLIKHLHPDCEEVVVVTDDTVTGSRIREEISRLSPRYAASLPRLRTVSDVSIEELQAEIAALSPPSVVLYTFFFKDRLGRFLEYDVSAETVSSASRVPVYGAWNFSFGHGIIGGNLISGDDQGRRVASMVQDYLNGTAITDIPVEFDTPTRFRFDFQRLNSFGINSNKLPGDSEVVGKPVSLFDEHRDIVMLALLVGGLILLASLLIRSLHAERALATSEKKFRGIFDQTFQFIALIDIQGTLVDINMSAVDLVGVTVDSVLGYPFWETPWWTHNPDQQAKLREAINRAALGDTVRMEVDHLDSEGNVHLVDFSLKPQQDENGEVEWLIAEGRDITPLRQVEAEQRELSERLHQSQKLDAVGQLAGGLAHDFNNMLAGIQGAAEVIESRLERPEIAKKYLKLITDTVSRASGLTSQMLGFARRERIDPRPLKLHKVILAATELLRHSLDKRIDIQLELGAGRSTLLGDFSLLESVFINLGINAGHAMEEGGTLTITTDIHELEYAEEGPAPLPPGTYLRTIVADTGTGIASEHIPRIFDPFFTTKERGKGTGLGLSAVYGAILQHHGRITVHSELRKGTTFEILIPVSKLDKNTTSIRRPAVRGGGHILLVEDEEILRETTTTLLKNIGYTVITATNGQEGVETYEQHQKDIDLVILDMTMPVMDGSACFQALRRINPRVRVIISSGYAPQGEIADLVENGAMDFLAKPYDQASLSRKIAASLS